MATESRENSAKLIDLLDRVLDKGVVISGDIVISVAGVDLLFLDIRILAGSLETILRFQNSYLTANLNAPTFQSNKSNNPSSGYGGQT